MPKSKYESHVVPKLPLIEMWARDGLNNEEIARNLGIAESTFYKYMNSYTELSEALKEGRDVADARVVNALYQNAIGFYFKEEIMAPSGQLVVAERYARPNVSAQTLWLKNRRPLDWRDKQDVALSGDLKQVVIVNDLEDDGDASQP